MDITKKVAKMRFQYHLSMLDVCNVLNQLGILKDDKAETVMKDHTMKAFECIDCMRYDMSKVFKKRREKMNENYKEVYFHEYCKTCKNKNSKDTNHPCDECLNEGARMNSHKPVNWKKRSNKDDIRK